MACFWIGILKNLEIDDFKKSLGIKHKPMCKEFIQLLKNNIILINNVKCNNENLTQQFINESMEHIKKFNVKKINKGYQCSPCEPVLILISELFSVNICHCFNGKTIINYTNPNATRTIYLSDNGKHMF